MAQISFPIKGYGLVLRGLTPNDAERIAEIASQPGFAFANLQKTDASKGRMERAADFVDHAIRSSRPIPRTGVRRSWGLGIESDGRLVGYIGLYNANCPDAKPSISYFVDPREQGKGIATAAGFLILGEYFKDKNAPDIYALVHADNKKSACVLAKLGYSCQEALKGEADDQGRQGLPYSLTQDDFKRVQKAFDARRDLESVRCEDSLMKPSHPCRTRQGGTIPGFKPI